MKIDVHDAEVKTATVEVRSLTISGRQVTQAVFRQLREEPIIDDATGQLRGVPWGTVNYHPDKCAERLAHLHVVWQLGKELRRSRVTVQPYRQETPSPQIADAWLDAAALRLEPEEFVTFVGKNNTRQLGKHIVWDASGVVFEAKTSDELRAYWAAIKTWLANDRRPGDAADVEQTRAALAESVGDADAPDLLAQTKAAVADELALREAHLERVEELQALPQLFIAT